MRSRRRPGGRTGGVPPPAPGAETAPIRPAETPARHAGDVIEAVLESGNRVRFKANGDSMHPFIRSGQQLVVEPVDAHAVKRGDVVLARLDRGLTAHRVVRIERRGGEVVSITMRGDNCELDDPPFPPAQLVGRINSSRWGNLVTIIALARRWVRRAI